MFGDNTTASGISTASRGLPQASDIFPNQGGTMLPANIYWRMYFRLEWARVRAWFTGRKIAWAAEGQCSPKDCPGHVLIVLTKEECLAAIDAYARKGRREEVMMFQRLIQDYFTDPISRES